MNYTKDQLLALRPHRDTAICLAMRQRSENVQIRLGLMPVI